MLKGRNGMISALRQCFKQLEVQFSRSVQSFVSTAAGIALHTSQGCQAKGLRKRFVRTTIQFAVVFIYPQSRMYLL
jgi:hypothetical protein